MSARYYLHQKCTAHPYAKGHGATTPQGMWNDEDGEFEEYDDDGMAVPPASAPKACPACGAPLTRGTIRVN